MKMRDKVSIQSESYEFHFNTEHTKLGLLVFTICLQNLI